MGGKGLFFFKLENLNLIPLELEELRFTAKNKTISYVMP